MPQHRTALCLILPSPARCQPHGARDPGSQFVRRHRYYSSYGVIRNQANVATSWQKGVLKGMLSLRITSGLLTNRVWLFIGATPRRRNGGKKLRSKGTPLPPDALAQLG